jgi:AsmA protein
MMTMKKLGVGFAVVTGLLAVALLVVVSLLDANQFRPQLEAMLGGAIGRTVTIGHIDVSLLSGGIVVQDLTIADDPAFSSKPFVTAKAVKVGVDLLPLVLSRSLNVHSLRLEQPHVALLQSRDGRWNFSTLAASDTKSSGGSSPAAAGLLVRSIAVADGEVTVGQRGAPNTGAASKDSVYRSIDLEVSNLSLTNRFPFHLTTSTPGGTLALDGRIGPVNAADAASTPFDAAMEVTAFDLTASGLVDPHGGLAGVIDFKGALESDDGQVTSKGQMTATKLRLVSGGKSATVPVRVDYQSAYSLKQKRGTVQQGDIHIGRAVARLTGSYDAGGRAVGLRMKLDADNQPAADLQAALPAAGVTVPAGASLRDGTFNTALSIAGTLDRLVITGPLRLENVTLAGFDLAGRLSSIPALNGLPKGGQTAIQTLAALLRVAADGIEADQINVVAPAIGALTGRGTISPAGDLSFRMVAKLNESAGSQLGHLAAIGRSADTLPFRITGTTDNPVFTPDVGQAAGEAARQLLADPETAARATSGLAGFFKGKKR